MNDYNNFYKKCNEILNKQYPSVKKNSPSKLPLSPFVIHLSRNIKTAIQKTVSIIYKMTHLKSYKNKVQRRYEDFCNISVPYHSLLMSYDFHLNPQDDLKLIEVNTNSAGYLLSDTVYQAHGENNSALSSLKESFFQEWFNFSGRPYPPQLTVIMDEQIKQQRMYVEFLMYKDLLNRWSWPCELCEAGDIQVNNEGDLINSHQQEISMIYNRCTDFYLEKFSQVKAAFLNQKCCISPQPLEYLLLADKERFCDWSSEKFLEEVSLNEEDKAWIRKTIPSTTQMNSTSAEKLWEKRKGFFFKPLRGYGGKSVYNGKTITRKVFNRLLKNPIIYQESVAPCFFQDSEGVKWKYDIRAYVYKDQVQQLVARLYQGQMTNVQVPYSGFAAVHID